MKNIIRDIDRSFDGKENFNDHVQIWNSVSTSVWNAVCESTIWLLNEPIFFDIMKPITGTIKDKLR